LKIGFVTFDYKIEEQKKGKAQVQNCGEEE